MPRSTRAGRRMVAASLAIFTLALGAAACGDDEEEPAASSAPATTAAAEAPATTAAAETTAAPETTAAAETTAEAETSAPEESSAASEPASSEAAPASIAMPEGGPIQIGMPYADYFAPPVETAIASCAEQYGLEAEVVKDPANYDEYNLKVQVAASAGNAPDIIVNGLNEVTSMGQSEYALDLASFVAAYPEFSAETMPTMDAGRSNGKLVSIPWGVSTPMLFVNTALLTAAGIDPATPFASFDELAAAAVKLTDEGKQQYGLSIPVQEGWIPLQFLLGAGTNIVDESGQVTFNSDPAKAIAGKLHELYANGNAATTNDDDQAIGLFTQGKVAMFLGSTGFLPKAVDAAFEWTTMEFPPVDPAVEQQIAAGGAGVSVFATPERQEASLALVRCMFELPAIKQVVEELGYMPVRTDAGSVLEPGLLENPPYKAGFTVFDRLVPWYAFPGENSAQALKVFVDSWQRGTQTGDDPGPVLDDAAEQVARLIAS